MQKLLCYNKFTKQKKDGQIMKKLLSFVILFTLMLTCIGSACGKDSGVKLDKVKNVDYNDGILSYDEVQNAEGYDVLFTRDGETLYEDKIQDTAIDVESLGLEGKITFTVNAYKGNKKGEKTQYEFTALSTFGDVIFEAEDNLYNFGTGKAQSNFRNNTMAHKGAYVGGLDDAGHGVYINYLCPFDGKYDFTAYYLRESELAHHDVWVNGEYQTKFVYTENTGWGGATFNPANVTVEISLKKGWNTISVMKNGDASDNWGAFAELDYFVLSGNKQKYDAQELIATYGEKPAYYRLEAEMGSPRKKDADSGLYMCKNPCIKANEGDNYSNGFLMGGVENTFDGVEWHFNSPVKAKYSIKIAYAAGSFDGSKPPRPSFVVTQEEVTPSKNVDFYNYEITTMNPLAYTGWNNVVVAEQSVEITLEKGKNFIYCIKLEESGFFQIDYCDLTFISEITE